MLLLENSYPGDFALRENSPLFLTYVLIIGNQHITQSSQLVNTEDKFLKINFPKLVLLSKFV